MMEYESKICGKKCYTTRKIAKTTLKKMTKRGRNEQEVYYCEGCDAYHLTSQNKVKARKRRRKAKKI